MPPAPKGVSSAEAVSQGLVRAGGTLQGVLEAIEEEFGANPPRPGVTALEAQTAAMDAIGKATGKVGLEPGQSIGALPGQGEVVLQNVGGIITRITPSGEIIITNARGEIILHLIPKA